MSEVIERRGHERDELIAVARSYAASLSERLGITSATVVGSVARGDFNVWSDIDVVVIAAELPDRAPDRAGLLLEDAPSPVQPIGFTRAEFERERRRGNPLVREAIEDGVPVFGRQPE